MRAATHEIRVKGGAVDEVLALDPQHVHLEQMSGKHWWIGVNLSDGRLLHVNLHSNSRIECHTEVDE